MPQLVGRECVRCRKPIRDEIDGRFCGTCGSPVHDYCAGPRPGGICPDCGAVVDALLPAPYVPPPPAPPPPAEPAQAPAAADHRGVLVFVLGVLSLVLCGPLGVPAWFLGARDLHRMRAGRISQEGRGLTQAGSVCGIIGIVLFGVELLPYVWHLARAVSVGK